MVVREKRDETNKITIKRNVNKKVQDLLKRSKKGNHTGMGESQFRLLGVMWKALADYEEKR